MQRPRSGKDGAETGFYRILCWKDAWCTGCSELTWHALVCLADTEGGCIQGMQQRLAVQQLVQALEALLCGTCILLLRRTN